MMCLACEQQGIWLAYLRKRGLITPDGYLVEQPPFLADAGDAGPAQPPGNDEAQPGVADTNKTSGDDPTAG
jgi:hypothetical protein